MDPGTIAIISAIGTAVSAVGAIQQGQAAQSAANFNAAVAANNAVLARQNAAERARREGRLGRKRLGELRAGIGAAGITLEGTPLDLLADSAAEEELSRLTILHGGEVQAAGFTGTAALERARGKAAKRAGFAKAGSTLLLGGASFAGSEGGQSIIKSFTGNPANVGA